ncbi:uncharacterized protein LODBEIA_P43640 [Lodderomyces beijingensis]|uniref:Protein kinase domain-containing protein n=1 Tax=Lodderomyces beijingensis TaxID=1775926 RepID=A0ABP0ZV67_9ASCO
MHLSRSINKLSLDPPDLSNPLRFHHHHQNSQNDDMPYMNIKNIDYDLLESKYQIFKYCPQYIHNYDISTPVLRDLIVDKPIYNDANKHVKLKKRKKKKRNGNLDEQGEEPQQHQQQKDEQKQRKEKKEERKEKREEMKELKRQHQREKRDLKEQHKQSYSGHYMKKVNSLSCANGGNLQVSHNAGQVNPYQLKTQFCNGLGITGMSRRNSEALSYLDNANNTATSDQFDNSHDHDQDHKNGNETEAETEAEADKCHNFGGYDSEKTEVDDDFNSSIAFKNPFNGGGFNQNMNMMTSMSKSSSYNNYNFLHHQPHQQQQHPNSRNNSVMMSTSASMNAMHPSNSQHSSQYANSQSHSQRDRRSSSITLINNSQNSSQNRYNNNLGGGYNVGHSTKSKRSSSIASRFMNIFTKDHDDGAAGEEDDNDDDDADNVLASSEFIARKSGSNGSHGSNEATAGGGINTMKRASSTASHRQSHTNHKPPNCSSNFDFNFGSNTNNGDSMHSSFPIQKSSTFDQTRSAKTTLKNKLKMKLTNESGRRFSESIEVVTENVTSGHTGEVQTIQYTQSQMVGHGSFGVVFQTQIMPANEICAMKRVLQDKRFKNRELQIMKLVHHRNVADLKYFFYTNNDKNELYLNLILEFVPETLYKASHYYVSKRLSMPPLEIKLYTYQMFRALNYIHSQGICHRDIKPQNLLINPSSGELKLCDFGSAKILNPQEPNVSYICSRYYRAPELIFGATNYTTKIDVWSAGCVMAELILGQPLFPGESGIDQLVEIIKILGTPTKEQIKNMNPNYMEHRFPQIKPIPLNKIFKKMSQDCIQFLIKVLQYSPIDRISCVEALCDGYFDELRNQATQLPNYRKLFSQNMHQSSSSHSLNAAQYQLYNSQPDMKPMPELFDFDDRELSVAPQLNSRLIPAWAWSHLQLRNPINNLSEFVPKTEEELKVSLE